MCENMDKAGQSLSGKNYQQNNMGKHPLPKRTRLLQKLGINSVC